jgi:hypothetical protein
MPNVSNDRALRKAVAKLHALPPDDFDAVLASLEGAERARVLALLSEFDGAQSQTSSESEPFAEVVVPPDLSPWLVARVNGRGDPGDETADPFVITSHAQKVLRHCAAKMMPQLGRAKRRVSLLDRVIKVFG